MASLDYTDPQQENTRQNLIASYVPPKNKSLNIPSTPSIVRATLPATPKLPNVDKGTFQGSPNMLNNASAGNGIISKLSNLVPQDAQAVSDRAAVGNAVKTGLSAAADVASLPLTTLGTIYNSKVVRPLRAAGVPIPQTNVNLQEQGLTPITDRFIRKTATTQPVSASKPATSNTLALAPDEAVVKPNASAPSTNKPAASAFSQYSPEEQAAMIADAKNSGANRFGVERTQANGEMARSDVVMPRIAEYAKKVRGENTETANTVADTTTVDQQQYGPPLTEEEKNFDPVNAYEARTGRTAFHEDEQGNKTMTFGGSQHRPVKTETDDEYNTRMNTIADAYNSPEATQFKDRLKTLETRRAQGLSSNEAPFDWQAAYKERTGIDIGKVNQSRERQVTDNGIESLEQRKARIADFNDYQTSPEQLRSVELGAKDDASRPYEAKVLIKQSDGTFYDPAAGAARTARINAQEANDYESAQKLRVGDNMTVGQANAIRSFSDQLKAASDEKQTNTKAGADVQVANINNADDQAKTALLQEYLDPQTAPERRKQLAPLFNTDGKSNYLVVPGGEETAPDGISTIKKPSYVFDQNSGAFVSPNDSTSPAKPAIGVGTKVKQQDGTHSVVIGGVQKQVIVKGGTIVEVK